MLRRHLENFPVASLLLPASLRGDILALYRFARGADDVADDPSQLPQARAGILQAVDAALQGVEVPVPGWAAPYLALCRTGRCNPQDGRDLLHAFLQDQTVTRCPDWPSMLGYCRYSAFPVGRSFLALSGEDAADGEALFALCACLQLLNHLQDIKGDYVTLGRIYLPSDWLEEAGVQEEELAASHCSEGLRQVIDRVREAMLPLMAQAATLPQGIRSRRLRLELRWVLAVVRSLHKKLGREDPLVQRVKPGWYGKLRALLRVLWNPPELSRSSFYWPMRFAPALQRRALFALHRFLRAVDQAADAPGGGQEALERWQWECALLRRGQAATPEGKALLPYIERFSLDVGLLEEVTAGCAMDAAGEMQNPPSETLVLYCERVAAAPGRLVLAVLGYREPEAEALASALGQALQRTNILRDEAEDEAQGRRYFSSARRAEFMESIAAYFAEAETLLRQMRPKAPLAVLLIRDVYWVLFCRLQAARAPLPKAFLPPWLLCRSLYYRATG